MSLLNIGSRALGAAQGALTTVSHNIANANTDGYSRQEAVLSTAGGLYTGSGFFGRGVDLTTIRRQYDQYLTGAVQSTTAASAADAARSQGLQPLDALFSAGDQGLGASLDALFSAAGDLANRPTDSSVRQVFLARAQDLATRLDSVGASIQQLSASADAQLGTSAAQVNARLTDINRLNAQIALAHGSGQTPNDLLDQRDAALKSLNELLSVQSVAQSDGTVSLFTPSGAPLLVGSQQSVLSAVPDAADPSRSSLQISIGNNKQLLDAADLGGGSMAGLMRLRDEDYASALNQVGRIAQVVADAFNQQQSLGVDMNGAPGAALFNVAAPQSIPNASNTGGATLNVTVANSAALQASDYNVAYDGTVFTLTRLSDGQSMTSASLPATFDGLAFAGSATPNAGDSWRVRPFATAATSLAARTLSPRQVATGYAATIEAAASNQGSVAAKGFAVTRASSDNTLPVTITFNNPPTSFNVTGLAGGNLTNVPYTPGQRVPAAPADYNGWSVTLDGTPIAGDTFNIKPQTSPGSDNRNALALQSLANAGLAGGATLNEAYASLLGDVGTRVQSATDMAEVSARLQAEAVQQQQNVSGVNLDEEAANLLRYQQAYQAAARIIQASQTVFDSLLAATGR